MSGAQASSLWGKQASCLSCLGEQQARCPLSSQPGWLCSSSRHRCNSARLALLVLLAASFSLGETLAHGAPTSFINLRISPEGIDASVTASNTDLAHGLPAVEPDMLLQPATVAAQRAAL